MTKHPTHLPIGETITTWGAAREGESLNVKRKKESLNVEGARTLMQKCGGNNENPVRGIGLRV